MERKITWEKFIDPLNANLDEVETPGFGDVNIHDINEVDDDLDEEDISDKNIHGIAHSKLMYTQFGLLTVTNNVLACNQFDFWVMHTNFPITHDILTILDNIDGIETIEVLTKYRIRIGFPKSGLFDPHEVKLDVQNKLLKITYSDNIIVDAVITNTYDEPTVVKINNVKQTLMDNGKYWAMMILPNGEIDSVESWDEAVVQQHIELYNDIQEMVSGDVLIYLDYQK
jgi:hypothetical protein